MNSSCFKILIICVLIIVTESWYFGKILKTSTTTTPGVDLDFQSKECPFWRLECTTSSRGKCICRRAGCMKIPIEDIVDKKVIKELDLVNNLIPEIPDMRDFPNLEVLRLDHNIITKIEDKAFYYNSYLTELYLSHNKLETLQKKLFRKAGNMRVLDLSNNKLKILERENFPFAFLSQLTQLSLADNHITEIGEDAFTDLRHLSKLDLSGNVLKTVDRNHFIGLSGLHYLYLRNCSIEHLKDTPFLNLYNLKKLDLVGNGITVIHPNSFHGLTNLQSLTISSNPIHHLQEGAFGRLPNLDALFLDRLEIEEISERFLKGQTSKQIRVLSLNENTKLKTIKKFSLSHLNNIKISISRNYLLSYIESTAFGSKEDFSRSNITTLILNDNSLSIISKNLVDWNKLEDVDFSGNRWNCNCRMRFLKENLTHLIGRQTAVCNNPIQSRGMSVNSVELSDFTCSHYTMKKRMKAILIITITIVFLFFSGFLFWKKREMLLGCCFGRKKQGYTRVTLNGAAKKDELIEPVNV